MCGGILQFHACKDGTMAGAVDPDEMGIEIFRLDGEHYTFVPTL
ncbi:hypothetical protein TVNIR_2298 [Thioalkalivibrio nitratireducens DSM 14787]|uniref:Uncharacterized protein n=1 Tax=Thioalkalivibrio nitratireducens (strain DSM 14787 / UNIQEM 213 / ALEN2) TaxID=1255043 RepID=L0DY71_THIND|nr:hypothetical protein TVNIR_2298 [Thioalkalivibrio nitratireducens DSM 14787]